MNAELRLEPLSKTFDRWKTDLCKKYDPSEPDRLFLFEEEGDYWNAVASVFLHSQWEKAFRMHPTFKNRVVDPFFSESYDVMRALSSKFPPKSADEDFGGVFYDNYISRLKPRFLWPWLYHSCDVMGSVANDPSFSMGAIAIGLVQPMEHLAFLTAVSAAPLFPAVIEDLTVSVTSDGLDVFGSVGEFRFRLPDNEDSVRRLESLKMLLERSPEKVRIIVPDTLNSWMSMRESYEERTSWTWNKEGLTFSAKHKVREKEAYFLPSRKDLASFPEDMMWNTISSEEGRSRVPA
ncbi:MAG: hypothetical protein UBAL2_80490402 [Leptospirillum rubarum]|uniref:Uncharacterized protein n=1 Tax=Leptospirillum sp. Group II '5-way CG' TaxID=419541 RepID=B6AS64_9BACT|nr:MAG: hypothetical protein UBAL2_80490402 [Leptospirillum rubarum]EDZ38318.1 MAG: Hypothetical protein CGL2_11278025 [Leptospirillum sp. Group II '5-way CG']